MITICAWCEQKGKTTIIKEENGIDEGVISHGICRECHESMNEEFKQRYLEAVKR